MSDNSRVRVSIVGVVVVALFSTLLARLWFLQAGPENSLKVQAFADSTRVIQTENPRGEIKDRNGVVLVKDRASWAVTVDRDIPKATAARVLGQLAEQLRVSVEDLTTQYKSPRQSPLEPAIVALDVSQPNRLAILQDPQDYPGVHVSRLTVRAYPQGDLAAQVLGYVGEVPAEDLARLKGQRYEPGDEIGRAGVEAVFEKVLRGRPRRETVEVDPTGHQVGGPLAVERGSTGDDVWLTIDAKFQRAAEDSLAQGIAAVRHIQNIDVKDHYETFKAPAGAALVLDARDGSVAALASYPTYSPSWWVGGISARHYEEVAGPTSGNRLFDRATQGLYAPGSTFKLVTSLAMTENGIRGIGDYYVDQGSVRLDGTTFHNASKESFGPVNLEQALTVSSDAYFYTVGDAFWHVWKGGDTKRGLGIQTKARQLGFGAPTKFDLDEAAGRVPDPEWKAAFAHANYKTKAQRDEYAIWYPYDDIFPAVGQGDLVVTPLQLANAYAAFANGGTLWQPRIERKVVSAKGAVKNSVATPLRHVTFDPATRAAMLSGFMGAVAQPKGTAYQAFQGFPLNRIPVAGKTGTAQVAGKGDTSLFAATFPADHPRYVVVVVVEQAGFGAQTAAPIARRIIEAISGQAAPPPVHVTAQGHD